MNTANKREMSEHAQVAKLCRQYCKSIGVKCKARSESYAGGDSVTVTIDDQPPHIVAQITNECKQYQYGHFDGMNDIYEYSNTDKNIPQTKFLFIQSHYSDELRQKAWSFIRNRFGVDQPEDYAEVNKYNTITDNSPVAIQEEVFRTLNGSEKCEFWDTLTTAQIIELPTQSDIKDIEISEGTKPGYSEIRFPGKPSESVRDTLKAAGYRWSRYNGCWWGKTDNIPTFSGFESDATSTPINHADKLRTIADKMQTTIDGKFADRQTNTPKRLAQANHTRFEGERLQRTQKALYALAGLHDLGTVPEVLQGLTTKKAVYDLMAEKTESVQNGYHEYRIGTNVAYYDTPEALALWELLTPESEADKQAKELQRKVDGLQFSNIPGYFPTPAPVIEQMLNYACVQSCHHVLEPSAGHGAIADALAAIMQDGHIDCVESNYTLRDILQAKGYNVIEHNFMELAADPLENEHFYYDRVVMNPPFENLQDVDHIRHAFDLLKDGGRLVSIMSPSPFTRSDKKCEAFRQWFDNLGGERVELPEGSFKPSGTNINTIMVIIDKN